MFNYENGVNLKREFINYYPEFQEEKYSQVLDTIQLVEQSYDNEIWNLNYAVIQNIIKEYNKDKKIFIKVSYKYVNYAIEQAYTSSHFNPFLIDVSEDDL